MFAESLPSGPITGLSWLPSLVASGATSVTKRSRKRFHERAGVPLLRARQPVIMYKQTRSRINLAQLISINLHQAFLLS